MLNNLAQLQPQRNTELVANMDKVLVNRQKTQDFVSDWLGQVSPFVKVNNELVESKTKIKTFLNCSYHSIHYI